MTGLQTLARKLHFNRARDLPSFEMGRIPAKQPLVDPNIPIDRLLYLLLCMNDVVGTSTVGLQQPSVHDIESDRQLFELLRTNYNGRRKRWWSFLSLWELQEIRFAKFEMYDTSRVDIIELDTVPPLDLREKAEYICDCPDLKPLIGPNFLMHYFRCPQEASLKTPCFNKIPKKSRERLTACVVSGSSSGWGLYFAEGWNWKKIIFLIFFALILLAVAAAILCWKFEHSIQDAFAISSYVLGFFAAGIGTFQVWLNMI